MIGPSADIGAFEADVRPVTVTKVLVPSADTGRFDLKVDSTVVKAGAGDGDSGTTHVTTGAGATVSEVAAAGTDLADYVTSIDCGSGGSASGSTISLVSVTVATTSTITNTRRPRVTVTNAVSPAGDAGRFDLRVGATVVKAGAGDGEQGSTTVVRGSDVTVSEVSATGPGLAAYDSSIDCGSGSVDGTTRTLVNVTADVTCTITNTRKSEPAPPPPPPPPPSGGTTPPPPSVTPPAPCSSARKIVVQVRGHYRRGTAKVAGRTFRFKVSRNRARVTINFAGLAKGTYRVRIELRSRSGRKVKQLRTYRICVR